MLSDLILGDKIWETLITLAIIAAVAFLIYGLYRKEARPIAITVFCIIWFFSGVYSLFTMIDYYSRVRNQTYGELQDYDPYEDFNFFEYDLTTINFYPKEDGTYYFEQEYSTSIEFEGNNQYTLLLNNSPCNKTTSSYGRLMGQTTLYFYDVDNSEEANINLDITLTFYSSSLKISIDTDANDSSIGFLREYTYCNGFNLRIIENVYDSGGNKI